MRTTSKDFNSTFVFYKNKSNGNLKDEIFAYSEDISTTGADAVGECYNTVYSLYTYIINRSK